MYRLFRRGSLNLVVIPFRRGWHTIVRSVPCTFVWDRFHSSSNPIVGWDWVNQRRILHRVSFPWTRIACLTCLCKRRSGRRREPPLSKWRLGQDRRNWSSNRSGIVRDLLGTGSPRVWKQYIFHQAAHMSISYLVWQFGKMFFPNLYGFKYVVGFVRNVNVCVGARMH